MPYLSHCRIVYALLIVLTVSLLATQLQAAQHTNVILIMTDDQGAGIMASRETNI
ncbi:hypothetical protein [Gimesia maris]|uniref:hypothetical protein n=1 Tax=Gimesia maris TaxID=122 RepID=UPI0012D39CF8|nr:hypothetical protein [Gimesia maris]